MPLMCAGGDEPDPMALCVDPVVRARQPHSVFSQSQRAAHTPPWARGRGRVSQDLVRSNINVML